MSGGVGPKTVSFTKFWNTNTPRGASFGRFSRNFQGLWPVLPRVKLSNLGIHLRNFGIMGI